MGHVLSRTRGNRRRVETSGGEFENCLNLLRRNIVLLDDLLDART